MSIPRAHLNSAASSAHLGDVLLLVKREPDSEMTRSSLDHLEILNQSKIKWLRETLRLLLSERLKCPSVEGGLSPRGSGGMRNSPNESKSYFLI